MSQKKEGKQARSINIWRALMWGFVGLFIFSVGVQFGRGDFGSFSLQSQNSDAGRLDFSGVNAVYTKLKQNFDGKLEVDKLNDGMKQGLAKATGDPYTEFLTKAETKDFDEDLSGTFTGIGAELGKDAETNSIVIVSPLAGFPAEKAGLRPKDLIVEIDGKSAYDISVTEAVKRIRGPEGTNVKLKVVRGQQETLTFDITRAEIKIPSVESKTLEGNIGYIKASRFGEDTAELVREAAGKFKQESAKGVILDLRGNPGGLLDASVSVSGVWLNDKTVLTERRGGKVVKTFESDRNALLEGVPTVVLIDEGSASASEIVAGALRDNKAATLMGAKSFGKGSVQSIERFKDGSTLKVTVARWFTPSGKNIDKEGITPDQKVGRSDDDIKNGRDPQLDAAKAFLQK